MEEQKVYYNTIKDVPIAAWDKLSEKKIYFGHQSVGFNIMDGVNDLMKEHPEIKLNIVETADESDFKLGLFAHSRVGKNADPKSKIAEFVNFMEQGIGGKTDFSFLKFCFVDVRSSTDIEDIFNDYKNVFSRLKKKYPDTTFLHVTVPLGTTKTSWKTWIKKVMRKKEIWEYDHNVARNKFNDLIKKEYQGKEPVFDLAKIESTYPDGRREKFERYGKTYYSMVPNYTKDGAHLNELGRIKVAEQLLILLANISQ